MTSIERLTGLKEDEIAALAKTGIHTATDLWERAGSDPNRGIDLLSKKCGLTKKRLVEILRLQGAREARRRDSSWIGRNWLELALLAGLALILGLLLVARSQGELAGLLALLGRPEPPQAQVVVSTPDGLPAFHRIGKGDLTLAPGQSQQGSFNDVGDAAGRFTLQAIPAGATVLASQLSVPVDGTSGMRLLSLPVASRYLGITQAGKPASLMLSPRQLGESAAMPVGPIDVIVLAESADGDTGSIVVAVKEIDLTALVEGLGYSEVIVMSAGE